MVKEDKVVNMEPKPSTRIFLITGVKPVFSYAERCDDERNKLGPDFGREMALHPWIHLQTHSISLQEQVCHKNPISKLIKPPEFKFPKGASYYDLPVNLSCLLQCLLIVAGH